MGLGYATLVSPKNGMPCISVHARTPAGVRIAGIMLEALALMGKLVWPVRSLLEWGTPDIDDPGDEKSPGVLRDVYARVGEMTVGGVFPWL